MKKKVRFIAAISAITLCTTGCSMGMVSLTDDEQGTISEYTAKLLLDHDSKSKTQLLPFEKVQAMFTPTPEAIVEATTQTEVQSSAQMTAQPSETTSATQLSQGTTETANEATAQPFVDLSSLYNKTGLKIDFKSYSVANELGSQGKDYMSLTAEKGSQFFVTHFSLKNTADKKQSLNFMKQNVSYELYINDKSYGSAVMTMLSNDMITLQTSVDTGKSKEAVLVFNIKSNTTVNSSYIIVRNEDKTAKIILK